MTPPAATQAGRTEAPHRRRVRRSPRPAALRRVSGPARGGATRAPAEPLTRPSTARRPLRASIGARADAFVRSLPDHPVLDRLIRGRVWIPLLGVMLAGIVAMQVEVLKLGASMGRSLQANSTLSAQNATLRESVASLADDQRIEQLAASMGMVMPPPSAVGFLSPHGRGVEAKAAANIHQPNPGSFDYLTSGNGAVVTPSSLAAWNSSGLLGSSTPSSTSTASAPTATTPTATSPTATTPTATTPTATTPTATTPTASTPTAVAPSSTTSAPTDATPVPAPSSATAADSTAADSTAADSTAADSATTDSAITGSSSSSASPATGAVAVAPATTQGG